MAISQNFPTSRPSLSLNFARSKILDPRITFERSSSATYVDENGIIQTAGTDVARFDHNPATGESLGLLIEEQRTNYYSNSENFTVWTTDGVTTVTTNQTTSPSGDNTADKMVGPYIYRYFSGGGNPISTGTTVTFSVFVKNNGANTLNISIYSHPATSSVSGINLSTGTVTSGSAVIVPYPDGWYRVSLTHTASTGDLFGAIEGLGGSGASQSLYIWGAQVEVGSFASSYVPTSGSTATRNADYASITGTNFSNWYNSLEGTFVAECDRGNDGVESGGIGVVRGLADTYVNMIQFGEFYDNGGYVGRIYLGGNAESLIGAVHTTGQGIFNKYSFAYKVNDVSGAINGLIQGTDTNSNIYTDLDRFIFGGWNNDRANSSLDGRIKYLRYYPTRLTNAQLQELTK